MSLSPLLMINFVGKVLGGKFKVFHSLIIALGGKKKRELAIVSITCMLTLMKTMQHGFAAFKRCNIVIILY